nr:hypothetical protein [Nitrosomonas communis]
MTRTHDRTVARAGTCLGIPSSLPLCRNHEADGKRRASPTPRDQSKLAARHDPSQTQHDRVLSWQFASH